MDAWPLEWLTKHIIFVEFDGEIRFTLLDQIVWTQFVVFIKNLIFYALGVCLVVAVIGIFSPSK